MNIGFWMGSSQMGTRAQHRARDGGITAALSCGLPTGREVHRLKCSLLTCCCMTAVLLQSVLQLQQQGILTCCCTRAISATCTTLACVMQLEVANECQSTACFLSNLHLPRSRPC